MTIIDKIALSIAIAAAVIAIAAAVIAIASLSVPREISTSVEPTARTFYINAIEPKGSTNISTEPFPNSTLPPGGGYELKEPDEQGNWLVETYVFDPSVLVVFEGDQITLNILGVNGKIHAISVEGYVDEFELNRGELKTVTFTADKVGTIEFICNIHQPTMYGQIIVLSKR